MMKIVAGMGCIDEYIDYANNGADEVFIGYVPTEWSLKYGNDFPINRREVRYYNVQIGSFSELRILMDMYKNMKATITIAFNSIVYSEQQCIDIIHIIRQCYNIGINNYIVANELLLNYILSELSELNELRIHLSGEFGEMNSILAKELSNDKISRIIFPRQTTIDEMKSIIKSNPLKEYEAFVLNEKCHYTGAYCNSYHCDELCHMCKIQYKLVGSNSLLATSKNSIQIMSEASDDIFKEGNNKDIDENIIGATGCGLCAMWELQSAGITHLKIVGRGKSSEYMKDDIKMINIANDFLGKCRSKEQFVEIIKEYFLINFNQKCSDNCYYL